MRLGTRIFIAYFLIFAVCFYYPFDLIARDLRTRYVEAIEDPLVDQANILAGIVGMEMERNRFSAEDLHTAFEHVYGRSLPARIYDLVKTQVDIRVYMTDMSGKITFDSTNRWNTGADYSAWRDVRLTLQGKYGARATRLNPKEPATVVLHVAAPIIVNGQTTGALTVAKPTTNVNSFLKTARPRIIKIGAVALSATIFLSLIVSYVITRPIRRLTQYAVDVREGKRVQLPELGRSELRGLGAAFEMMREALEGRKYVERYVQTLTHEIKAPLSAIRGAAELMEEEMSPDVRARFLSNIRTEANRIQRLVDRMLRLSELENKKFLDRVELVPFSVLIRTTVEEKEPLLSQKHLQVQIGTEDDVRVPGDSFLLRQAASNLIQNAIDFSPAHGRIDITIQADAKALCFTVEDEGPGIPEYAREKVFDKFFSLQRPDTGKKSTGLGLNLVKEVAALHHGDIRLENREGKGLRATLRLPV
ncbi:two-component system sensor histidine kinase CreC [Syntrophobacter fumaroxidans]|uniref:histidine kinase n=1 Tax=Syntrophobacter fumaroxidans (strain DSM 10017 / MPOB) TaxID=335543 RepID=A0LLN3_SYNFM|nr:two-component system sensor histidine kinase CreC [Syntrophobacter fumaroxidans]ABK18335.1 integral membrane sensor signal transduction histidine kinase [Syntrophobacter fumaroxidans MPOB]